jgi:hypothetical protein
MLKDNITENENDSVLNDIAVVTPKQKRGIQNAKNALYVVVALLVVRGIISTFIIPSSEIIDIWIEIVIVAGIFLVLAMLTETKPYQALLIGLILYLLYEVVNVIINPTTIFKGIIFKVAIVVYLIKGLNSAQEVKRLKEIMKN